MSYISLIFLLWQFTHIDSTFQTLSVHALFLALTLSYKLRKDYTSYPPQPPSSFIITKICSLELRKDNFLQENVRVAPLCISITDSWGNKQEMLNNEKLVIFRRKLLDHSDISFFSPIRLKIVFRLNC